MTELYDERNRLSIYLSTEPDDQGIKYRLSGDLLLVYETARACPCKRKRTAERASIVGFSATSGSRMGRYLRECTADYRYMHTLTYPSAFPTDGRIVKEHLRRYLQSIARLAAANGRASGCSQFWFLEFQKRGAPHFHIFTTEFVSFETCRVLWYDIVGSGDSRHLSAGIRVERLILGKKGMVSYAKKFARKTVQKDVPTEYKNVGRFWGVLGVRKVMSAAITFFNDSCENHDISALHLRLQSLIKRMVALGHLHLVKRVSGFAMFHVEHVNLWYGVLKGEIDSSCAYLRELEDTFHDAEVAVLSRRCYDTQTGVYLSESDSYLFTKWGSVEEVVNPRFVEFYDCDEYQYLHANA
jgi:hypothetical protein